MRAARLAAWVAAPAAAVLLIVMLGVAWFLDVIERAGETTQCELRHLHPPTERAS